MPGELSSVMTEPQAIVGDLRSIIIGRHSFETVNVASRDVDSRGYCGPTE
jgi:hypothetical protein